MALNIKNSEVEGLVAEMARLTGETKTETVRRALIERRQRMSQRVAVTDRGERLLSFLEREVWPHVPADQLGRRLTSEEEDAILGYGAEGA